MIKKKLPVYYHNPRCSKSRQGKELLELKKISFDIKEYLKTSFEKEELLSLFTKLDKKPIDIIRTKEKLFKELELKDQNLNNEQWAEVLIKNPILLERPILCTNDRAIVGRPPEDLLTILD
jgi:arsenate reductase (glutaredoxin)